MDTVLVDPLLDFIEDNRQADLIAAELVRQYVDSHIVPAPAARLTLSWPVAPPPILTQQYGVHKEWYAPFGLPGHEGIDIRALNGTPVLACADGIVSRVETNPASGPYGNQVRVKHKVGDDLYETVYAHQLKANVKVGQVVNRTTLLGLADSTGHSSGPHLHLTLKHYGHGSPWMNKSDIVNPTPYFPSLFPGRYRVDVGGNLRTLPAETAPVVLFLRAGPVVQAIDFGGAGGDWWKVIVDPPFAPVATTGWFWQPGFKMSEAR